MAAADDRARKAWWASIGVGALACVGCCVVVPLLAAAGIAGGGMLLVGSRWLEPLGFALIAVGVVGVVVSQIRAYRRRGADTCQCTRPVAGADDHSRQRPQCPARSPRVITMVIRSILLFVLAAVAEIGGAWLIWQGVREQRGWLWAGLGVIALGIYGFVATLQPDAHFGRILAAYGGVFVAGSLAWGMALDGFRPDRWDIIGALVCLAGVAVIMYGPRAH